jgi:hypothetical protein
MSCIRVAQALLPVRFLHRCHCVMPGQLLADDHATRTGATSEQICGRSDLDGE